MTPPGELKRLHRMRLGGIKAQMNDRFGDMVAMVARKSEDALRRIQRESTLYGFKGSDDVKKVIRDMRERYVKGGGNYTLGFKDNAERVWHMDRYTDMAGRTVTANARRTAREMEFLAHGQNLVQISSHLPTCEKCLPWNGVVVSLTEPGDEYPHTLQEAQDAGLFHPNCLHSFTLYIPTVSEYGEAEPDYSEEGRERGKQAKENAKALMERQIEEERQKRRKRYWEKKLTDEEAGALNRYVSSDSYKINEKLRNQEKLSDEEKKFLADFDKALDKMPEYKGTVYRNITFDLNGEDEYNAFIEEHSVGNMVRYSQYTSTSKTADGYVVDGNRIVHYEIRTKNGKNISGAGFGVEGEDEVLLKRNAKFKVSHAEKRGSKLFLWMDEL
jgi:hypothetical protein